MAALAGVTKEDDKEIARKMFLSGDVNKQVDDVSKVMVMHLKRFSVECRETKTNVISLANHNKGSPSNEAIRTCSKCISRCAKRRKTRASKSRLLLLLLLIG